MGQRTYPVPVGAQSAMLASATATLDDLDRAALCGSVWADKIVRKENARILDAVLGGDPRLPAGVLADGSDDAVVALYRAGMAWRGDTDGWVPVGEGLRAAVLDGGEVAFVARALNEGADAVVLRPVMPVAFLTAAAAAPVDVPEGGKVLAVVDELDKSAVMDLVVVMPGPRVMRRHDGEWREDDKWLSILRSVKPPPVVVLDAEQTAAVVAQVDEMTAGVEWEETDVDGYINASAWGRADEMVIEFAILASKAASKATPGGTMPANLRRYWAYGPGAAKVRWGTPGAWRRCHRYLSKYLGPFRSKGACTNLAKLRGGHGVATHVG